MILCSARTTSTVRRKPTWPRRSHRSENPKTWRIWWTLIRADIERMCRGQSAHTTGDHGPLGNGGIWSYARWHIAAVIHLDPTGADQVLIDLLPEPEYRIHAAAAMVRDFVPKREHSFDTTFRYDLMWAAREGRTPPPDNDQRRTRFVAALKAEIKRLREQNEDGKSAVRA